VFLDTAGGADNVQVKDIKMRARGKDHRVIIQGSCTSAEASSGLRLAFYIVYRLPPHFPVGRYDLFLEADTCHKSNEFEVVLCKGVLLRLEHFPSLMTRTQGVGTHGPEMSVLRPIHLMSAFAPASQTEMGSWRNCMQGMRAYRVLESVES
jgi:hypothetical protein